MSIHRLDSYFIRIIHICIWFDHIHIFCCNSPFLSKSPDWDERFTKRGLYLIVLSSPPAAVQRAIRKKDLLLCIYFPLLIRYVRINNNTKSSCSYSLFSFRVHCFWLQPEGGPPRLNHHGRAYSVIYFITHIFLFLTEKIYIFFCRWLLVGPTVYVGCIRWVSLKVSRDLCT